MSDATSNSGLVGKVVLAFVSPVIFFSLLEFSITTVGEVPRAKDPIVIWNGKRDAEIMGSTGEFRFHSRWLWEPRPGAASFGTVTNEGSYRGAYYPPGESDAFRVAVMGDSSTYGINLPEEQSWGRYLEKSLQAYGFDAEVLNFGCVGFSLEQGYQMYLDRVRNYRPDVVIVAFGAVNDQFPALLGFTDREKTAIVSRSSYVARDYFRRYAFFRILENWLEPEEGAVTEIRPDTMVPRVSLEQFELRLEDLADAVREDGASLILVSPPRRLDGEMAWPKTPDYTKRIHQVAERLHIPVSDVHSYFREEDRRQFGEQAGNPKVARDSSFFMDQWHPSRKGHRLYGTVVGLTLQEEGLLPEKE